MADKRWLIAIAALFAMIRLHYRYLMVLIGSCFFITSLYSFFSSPVESSTQFEAIVCPSIKQNGEQNVSHVRRISCSADGGKRMQCLRDDDDVYFPFEKFLKKQFDVTGKLSRESQEAEHFEWYTSYSKMRYPEPGEYDTMGPFGHFASYNVESRDRVRCISPKNGVPMSTQWSPVPYFYPIQIAQYALQHYSRDKINGPSYSIQLGMSSDDWTSYGVTGSAVVQHLEPGANQSYIEIKAADSSMGSKLNLNQSTDLGIISFLWKPSVDASFTVAVQHVQTKTIYMLHFVHKEDVRCVWHESHQPESTFYYALGENMNESEWKAICRDLLVDARRAVLSGRAKRKYLSQWHPGDIRGLWIAFSGQVLIKDLRQRSAAHLDFFQVAADWFLTNQNERGGWSVPVERSIADKRLVMPAGWHSAMAQGHALSVLTRAYGLTRDPKYLHAAVKAVGLFKTAATEGGVRNDLFGHPWFEEYPTTPGSFVLNGFMYSLIGLYELSRMPDEYSKDALELFQEGINSLRIFLPLYDTGSGSIYDLRHLGLQTAPNLARWDYHAVHIYLLKWLFNITKEQQFNKIAERWVAYAHGRRAKHN